MKSRPFNLISSASCHEHRRYTDAVRISAADVSRVQGLQHRRDTELHRAGPPPNHSLLVNATT